MKYVVISCALVLAPGVLVALVWGSYFESCSRPLFAKQRRDGHEKPPAQ